MSQDLPVPEIKPGWSDVVRTLRFFDLSTWDPTSRALLAVQIVTFALYALVLSLEHALRLPQSLSTMLNIISDACAAFACFHASRHPAASAYGRGWRLLAAANLAYVVGTLGWFFPTIAREAETGLSIIDLPYFLFYPLVFFAVMAWPRRAESKMGALSCWLEALVLPIGAGMAVWFGLADALARLIEMNPGGVPRVLLYPFADLVLLFAVVLLTRNPVDAFSRPAATLIALALFVSIIADIRQALALLRDSRLEASWPDLVYVAVSLIFTLAAAVFRREAGNDGAPRRGALWAQLPRLAFLIPAAGAGVGFLFLLYDALTLRDLREAGLAVGASLLLAIGTLRTVLAQSDGASNATQLSETLDQLRQSQGAAEAARKRAEEALQAKTQFFAVMGHEIRTPLNAVIGMTQILLATPLSGPQRESAEVIRQGGDALLAVVNDLLDFSKMEAGRLEIEKAPLNPGRVIERLALLMQETARARDLTISVKLGSLPRVALGDEARIGQILLNLLSNAIKFSNGGVIRISAKAREVETGFDLTVSVADPGIGIAADKLCLLFQPFAQLSPGATRNYGGTGLGLAICKRLTELMGGSIQVRSQAGVGSEFTFHVHLDPASHLTTVPIPPVVPGRPHRRPDGVGLNVLVVEDNIVNQLVARSMVELLGHTAEVAESGQDALRLMAAGRYDIVLTDLMMPDMDGVETTRRLRETENGRRALIVAVTAAATVEDRERCLASGMDGFLAKPFTLETLRALFERLG